MRRISKNLLLLLFVILVCLGILEIATRLLWDDQWSRYGYSSGLYLPDETKGYRHQPLYQGSFKGKLYEEALIKINSKGLRDNEYEYEKPSGKIRILGLGDSITFGVGVDFEGTYLHQLEKRFTDDRYDIEVIKAGVDGYEFDQQYTYFMEDGYKYNSDIVLIGIVLNDARLIDVAKTKNDMFPESKGIEKVKDFLSENFKSLKFIYSTARLIKIRLTVGDFNEAYYQRIEKLWEGDSLSNYQNKMLDLNENLTKQNKQLVLVIFPFTEQFYNYKKYGDGPQGKIKEFASKNNIKVIDVKPILDVENYLDYYLPYDHVHLNEKGYKLVIDFIYPEVKEAVENVRE